MIPELPEVLFDIGDFAISRRMGMFGVFIVLMVAAAYINVEGIMQEKGEQEILVIIIH